MIQRINRETAAVLALPEVRETLMKQGLVPAHTPPDEIAGIIRNDIERWKKFIAETKITAD